MALAKVIGSTATELTTTFVTSTGVQYSLGTLDVMGEVERNGVGVYTIVDDAIPAGKISTGSTLEFVGGQVKRHWTLVDAPVPIVVTRRQGRLALLAAAKLDAVESAIAAASRDTQIWYQDAPVWERANPILNTLATQLGLTSTDLDNLFKQASAL